MKKIILFVLLSLASSLTIAKSLSIEARAGALRQIILSEEKKSTWDIHTEISLTSLHEETQWRPSIFIGFLEDAKQKNSAKFVLMKNKPQDKFLTCAICSLEHNTQQIYQAIGHVPLEEKVIVDISIKHGIVVVSFNNGESIRFSYKDEVKTPLLKPFISVSSGKAIFLKLKYK